MSQRRLKVVDKSNTYSTEETHVTRCGKATTQLDSSIMKIKELAGPSIALEHHLSYTDFFKDGINELAPMQHSPTFYCLFSRRAGFLSVF